MALGIAPEVVGVYVADVSLINVSLRDQARTDEIPQPLGREGVDFRIVRAHSSPFIRGSFLG